MTVPSGDTDYVFSVRNGMCIRCCVEHCLPQVDAPDKLPILGRGDDCRLHLCHRRTLLPIVNCNRLFNERCGIHCGGALKRVKIEGSGLRYL